MQQIKLLIYILRIRPVALITSSLSIEHRFDLHAMQCLCSALLCFGVAVVVVVVVANAS